MVARYGDFVRLNPPLNAMTFMLWGAPDIAVLVAIAVVLLAGRRHRAPPARPAPLTEAERRRLDDLLQS
jgi:cytochrome c-type biogenesis protein CcmH